MREEYVPANPDGWRGDEDEADEAWRDTFDFEFGWPTCEFFCGPEYWLNKKQLEE